MVSLAKSRVHAPGKLIRTCSIWRALEAVGDSATLIILESIWWGDRRFSQIQTRTGIQKMLISNRLKQLISNGIVEKRAYSERPIRYEYILTQKGRELYWTTLMLVRWERKWSRKKDQIKTHFVHLPCGSEMVPEPLCGHCKEVIKPEDVVWEEGPGVGFMAPSYTRRRQRKASFDKDENHASVFTEVAQIMGDRWSSLIMRSVFTGLRKFDQILEDTGIASNILSERLAWLTRTEVLEAEAYQTNPIRHVYRPTEKGWDYYPVLLMLQKWGDTHYASPEGVPVLLRHKTCGQPLVPYVGCLECSEPLRAREVDFSYEVTLNRNGSTD